jgi:hypothetical protein
MPSVAKTPPWWPGLSSTTRPVRILHSLNAGVTFRTIFSISARHLVGWLVACVRETSCVPIFIQPYNLISPELFPALYIIKLPTPASKTLAAFLVISSRFPPPNLQPLSTHPRDLQCAYTPPLAHFKSHVLPV